MVIGPPSSSAKLPVAPIPSINSMISRFDILFSLDAAKLILIRYQGLFLRIVESRYPQYLRHKINLVFQCVTDFDFDAV